MTQHTPAYTAEERAAALRQIAKHGNLWPEATEELLEIAKELENNAAPDLLEALRDLYALTEGLMLRDGSGPVRCTAGAMRAEQALAKAEGRG